MRAAIDMSWADDGACKDTPVEWWFPDEGQMAPAEALALCRSCPVYQRCLAHALEHEQVGVWAATSVRDRQRLRRAAGLHSFVERDPVVVDQVVRMHAGGFTPPQISEVTNVTIRTVYRILAETGHAVTSADDWRRRPRTAGAEA